MAAASYATNLTDILVDFSSTTGWSAIGTGGAGLNAPETDYYIQGSNCITKNAWASAVKGMIYDSGSDQGGSGTDGAYICWMTHTAPNALDTQAGGGMRFIIGSSTSAYEEYNVGGSDTMEFQGWKLVAVNEATAGDQTTGSPSATVEQTFGGLWDLPSGGPTKGSPAALDGFRVGRCDIVITNGDVTPNGPATFDGVITSLEDAGTGAGNRYGLLTQREPGGTFENSGLIQFGTSGTACRFEDSAKALVLREHPHVTTNFNTWEVNNASTVFNMTNISVTSLGTTSPGRLVVNNDATVTWTGCTLIGWGTFTLDANTTMDGCTFLNCGQITANEADLSGSSFLSSTVAADGAQISWAETISAGHSITELDNTTFEMGTNNHHAISFSTGVSNGANITLTGIAFNGFDADGTGDSDNSMLEFLATTGTITVNLVDCTVDGSTATASNMTADTRAGCTVNFVSGQATVTVNVKDEDGVNIQSARVFVETAATAGGGEAFEQSVTSITQSAGTATVTTGTAHGLEVNDVIVIRGAQPDGYNKVATVLTAPTTTTFTYTVSSGLSSPATGTPLLSYVAAHGLTDASGNVATTRSWVAQDFKGWARKKNASSPFYKDANFAFTVDASNGNTINAVLLPDE